MTTKGKKVIEKQNQALEQLKIEYVSINAIQPNDYNPNRQSDHDFSLLMKSMEEDGFTQPIIIQTDTNIIVDGEHRWRAAYELGMTEVPIVRVPMTPEQMRIATLRHNRARGNEDIELSTQVLRDLQSLGALDWAQDSLLLDDIEINRLLEDIPAPEALASEEYNVAWEPVARTDVFYEQENGISGMTPAAVSQMREVERRVSEARNDEERAAARKDADIFRISLSFTGAEANLVRGVLSDSPAKKVLELCQAELERDGNNTINS